MAKAHRKAPPKALNLTTSMRVLRTHYARPSLTVADAQDKVKQLALRLGTGKPTKDELVLEEKLQKATRVSVAELAQQAEEWPL